MLPMLQMPKSCLRLATLRKKKTRRTVVLERIKFRFIFLLFWQVFAYKQLETLPRLHSVTLHLCCLAPSEKSRVRSAPEKPPDLTGSEPRMVCHTLSLAASLLGIGTPNPSPPRMGPGVVTVGSKKHVLGRRRLLGEEACQAHPHQTPANKPPFATGAP